MNRRYFLALLATLALGVTVSNCYFFALGL